MMKAIVIRKHIKTTKDFSVEEIPDDACPDDGVLVKVKAIGLNCELRLPVLNGPIDYSNDINMASTGFTLLF